MSLSTWNSHSPVLDVFKSSAGGVWNSNGIAQFNSQNTSGVTGGGREAECPPETSDQEIFADVLGKTGKKRQGKKMKKGKIEKKRRKIVKVEVENWK